MGSSCPYGNGGSFGKIQFGQEHGVSLIYATVSGEIKWASN